MLLLLAFVQCICVHNSHLVGECLHSDVFRLQRNEPNVVFCDLRRISVHRLLCNAQVARSPLVLCQVRTTHTLLGLCTSFLSEELYAVVFQTYTYVHTCCVYMRRVYVYV